MSIETEPRKFSPAEIEHNVGREAFTALEEYMQGSTALPEGLEDPLKPLGIIRGLSVEEVIAMRRKQAWFSTFMAYEMDGLNGLYQVPLFLMVGVNSEGLVMEYPKLYGVWDRRTQEIDRSIETLYQHEITPEKYEKILDSIRNPKTSN